MRNGWWIAALLVGCAAPVGPDDNPSELVDSAGYAFEWTCDGARCGLGAVPYVDRAPPCPDALWSFMWGRFFELCVVCPFEGGWSTTANLCRPATCESDLDCPQLYGQLGEGRYECESGLCQQIDVGTFPRDVLERDEAEVLCFRDLQRELTMSLDDPRVIEILAGLEETCPIDGDHCELPPSCAPLP